MTKNKNTIIFSAVLALIVGLAIFQSTLTKAPAPAVASGEVCTTNDFKACDLTELNELVTSLNSDLEVQNKLIVDIQANLEKAQTNKKNLENQKSLIVTSRDSKLIK